MKVELNGFETFLLSKYVKARDEFEAAKKAAGPNIIAIADGFESVQVILDLPGAEEELKKSLSAEFAEFGKK